MCALLYARAPQIKAYFSGCLTAQLRRPRAQPQAPRRSTAGRVLLIDVTERERVPAELLAIADASLSSRLPCEDVAYEKGFPLARARLLELADAELVITSRLHVASPAVAVGARVVFVPARAHQLPGGGRGGRVSGMDRFFHSPEDANRLGSWPQLPRGPRARHEWERMRVTQWAALASEQRPGVVRQLRASAQPPTVTSPRACDAGGGARGGDGDCGALHFVWLERARSSLERLLRTKALEAALFAHRGAAVRVWLLHGAGVEPPATLRVLREVGLNVRVHSVEKLLRPTGTAADGPDGQWLRRLEHALARSANWSATSGASSARWELATAVGVLVLARHGGVFLDERVLLTRRIQTALARPHPLAVLLADDAGHSARGRGSIGLAATGCGGAASARGGVGECYADAAAAILRALLRAAQESTGALGLAAAARQQLELLPRVHLRAEMPMRVMPLHECGCAAAATVARSTIDEEHANLPTLVCRAGDECSGGRGAAPTTRSAAPWRASGGGGRGRVAATTPSCHGSEQHVDQQLLFRLRAGSPCHALMAATCYVCHDVADAAEF